MNSILENEITKFLAVNFGNTKLGLGRIRKNLGLTAMSDQSLIEHCKKIILSVPPEDIILRGKNYYLSSTKYSAVLTINKSSLGIITAKTLDCQP